MAGCYQIIGVKGTYYRLKLDYKYALSVYNGTKRFEIRYDDRGYKENDFVSFKIVNAPECLAKGGYGWRLIADLEHTVFRIGYVLRGFEGLASGKWVAFSLIKETGLCVNEFSGSPSHICRYEEKSE